MSVHNFVVNVFSSCQKYFSWSLNVNYTYLFCTEVALEEDVLWQLASLNVHAEEWWHAARVKPARALIAPNCSIRLSKDDFAFEAFVGVDLCFVFVG